MSLLIKYKITNRICELPSNHWALSDVFVHCQYLIARHTYTYIVSLQAFIESKNMKAFSMFYQQSTFVCFHSSISFTCVNRSLSVSFLSLFSISPCCSSALFALIGADIKSIISLFSVLLSVLRFFARMALAGQGRTMKIDGVSLVSERKGKKSEGGKIGLKGW